MSQFTREDLAKLLSPRGAPCVTICLPTHRRPPEAQQDPIRYRNLLKEALAQLDEQHDRRAEGVAAMISQLAALGETATGSSFWSHQRDGLAVFASPDHFSWHSVPVPLRDITVVADSFHVKPLLPLLYDDGHYHVLCVNREDVRVFEGWRDGLEELSVNGVPRALTDAVGEDWDDSRDALTFHGTRGGGAAGQHVHGAGAGERSVDAEFQRFLRAVDHAVLDRVTRPSGRPLILCALEEYHGPFRGVSKNPQLVERGIVRDPAAMGMDEIRAAAWDIFEPHRTGRVDRALDDVGAATGRGQGAHDLADVARACAEGRVKLLLLQDRHRVWGRVDRETGAVALDGAEGQAGAVDLLDELAEMTLARGGEVLLVPEERMPAPGGVAAAYRF